jgi:hypothetical protein
MKRALGSAEDATSQTPHLPGRPAPNHCRHLDFTWEISKLIAALGNVRPVPRAARLSGCEVFI